MRYTIEPVQIAKAMQGSSQIKCRPRKELRHSKFCACLCEACGWSADHVQNSLSMSSTMRSQNIGLSPGEWQNIPHLAGGQVGADNVLHEVHLPLQDLDHRACRAPNALQGEPVLKWCLTVTRQQSRVDSVALRLKSNDSTVLSKQNMLSLRVERACCSQTRP